MTRRHGFMLVAGGFLVVAAWFALLWSPKGADLAAARERRSAAEQQADQLRARLAGLRAAKADGPALRAKAERLAAAVPDHADLATFLLDADAAAKAAGVDYLSVTPNKPTVATTGGPSEVAITLQLKGGYFKVLDLLDRLEGLPRVVVIDTMGITADDETVGSPPLTLAITGRVFTTEVPTTPGAAPTAAATPTASATGTAPAPTSAPTSNAMVP